jgi:hypothetical protein
MSTRQSYQLLRLVTVIIVVAIEGAILLIEKILYKKHEK